jgi:6-phosphofructokinase 1
MRAVQMNTFRPYEFPAHGFVSIPVLGKAHVLSTLPSAGDGAAVRLLIDSELAEEFAQAKEFTFEQAGPRNNLYFDPAKTKAAIVTCGGICPGINDVIRSLVHTLHREYKISSVLGIRYGLSGLIPSYKLGILELTPGVVANIPESGGTFLGTSRGPQPVDEVIEALERLNVNILFVIGGDGSMRAAAGIDLALREGGKRIAVIGIPKTIDNDIYFVPRSFGFETAVDRTVGALRCAKVEAMSVRGGIGIVKMMGRESGFIAAHATLAYRDVDFVLVPESPFVLHGQGGLIEALENKLAANGHALIAVAEGAGQDLIPAPDESDASGNRHLGDIAAYLMREIGTDFDSRGVPCHFKYIDPSYMVRSVPAGINDRIYAATLGQHAVHAAMSGRTGMVVAQIMDKFVHLPLALVTKKRRKINPRSSLWRSVLVCTGQDSLTAADMPRPEAQRKTL